MQEVAESTSVCGDTLIVSKESTLQVAEVWPGPAAPQNTTDILIFHIYLELKAEQMDFSEMN